MIMTRLLMILLTRQARCRRRAACGACERSTLLRISARVTMCNNDVIVCNNDVIMVLHYYVFLRINGPLQNVDK